MNTSFIHITRDNLILFDTWLKLVKLFISTQVGIIIDCRIQEENVCISLKMIHIGSQKMVYNVLVFYD